MQKPMYPCKVIRITQKDHEGTHVACWAVDEAGIDGGISNFIMPFDGKVKKIYTADANEVWIESTGKVEYPDGTVDYMTLMFAHDNDVSNLYVGQVIKAGTIFYQEGTKGKATGNHVHFECGKGKFTGSGWYQDASGAWSIINGKKATDCLWIDDSYNVIETRGYTFKKVVTQFGTPVKRDEYVDQVQIKDEATVVRARKSPNGDILGYMNVGLYNILEYVDKDGYTWYRVEKDLWFAYSPDWAIIYPKKEKPEPTPIVDEDKVKIEQLEKELEEEKKKNEEYEKLLKEKDEQIKKLEEDVKNLKEELLRYKEIKVPRLIFVAEKEDYYAIKLEKNDELYILRGTEYEDKE